MKATFTLLLGALLLTASCSFGYDPTRHPSASTARGTTVTVTQVRRGRAPAYTLLEGELLAVTDSGLIVAGTSGGRAASLVRVPYDLDVHFTFVGSEGRRSIRGPSERAAFDTAVPVARHPFGLTPGQLTELLRLSGQDTMTVAVVRDGRVR